MLTRTLTAMLFAACLATPVFCQADAEAEAAKQKAIDVFLKGELDEALKLFDAAIKRNQRDDELLAYRAAIYLEKREFTKADADLKAALELNPNSMLGYHNRGYGKWLRGQFADAVADYSSAINVGIARHARRALTASNLASMYQNRGVAYEDLGDLERAAIDFTRCIQLHPERSAYHVNRGLVYLKRNMHSEAISDLDEALFLDPLNPQTRVNRAFASYQMDDYDAAVRDYTRALYLKPEYIPALIGRGNAHVARGSLTEAANDFEAALKLRADLCSGHAGLGLVAAQRGSWPEAEQHYRRAAQTDANDSNALRGLGISLWKQGKLADAMDQYRNACRRAPSNAALWHDLGRLCAEQNLQEEALVALGRCLELTRDAVAPRRLRAEVHMRRAEWLLAISDLEQASRQLPSDGGLCLDLASCFARRSRSPSRADLDAGLEQVRRAALAGIARDVIEKDDRLKSLQGDPRWIDAVQGK